MAITALLVPGALGHGDRAAGAGTVGTARDGRRGGGVDPAGRAFTATAECACDEASGEGSCLALTVQMAEGPLAGRDVVAVESIMGGKAAYGTGDHVVLVTGEDPTDPAGYQIVNFQRGVPLLGLAVLFAAAVAARGRWRGVAALAALGLTALVLAVFALPAILAGRDPLVVAVVGSCGSCSGRFT